MDIVNNKRTNSISESDDEIDELRKLAIISMLKQVQVSQNGKLTDSVVNENTNTFADNLAGNDSSHVKFNSSIIRNRKRSFSKSFVSELSSKHKLDQKVKKKVYQITQESVSSSFDINSIINYNRSNAEDNLVKEKELKVKLLKVLDSRRDTQSSYKVSNKLLTIAKSKCFSNHDTSLNESDDDFDVFTERICFPPKSLTNVNAFKYHNVIDKVKLSISELNKSIATISRIVQNKLVRSKMVSTQIENLKTHKMELHKEISVNRGKILNLNKIKKLKSLQLFKYEHLKRKLSSYQPHVPLVRKSISQNLNSSTDSSSQILSDTVDLENSNLIRSKYYIDCNHIICPSWLQTTCDSKNCLYQHPKIDPKSSSIFISSKNKGNDVVFLKELKPSGFVSKLLCNACNENILISSEHMTEDWHCKTCCQQLVTMKESAKVLNQLILIWHHIYKRFLMSKTLCLENRDPSILQNLYKCSEAIMAKLYSSVNLPVDTINLAGYHIIVTLNEETKTDELEAFIKKTYFHTNFILFATSNLSFPVHKLHHLMIDCIGFQIKNSNFENIELLISRYCFLSRCLEFPDFIDQLNDWLDLCIRINVIDSHNSVISTLTKTILSDIIEPQCVPCLSCVVNDFELGDKYWVDRKNRLLKLLQLYMGTSYVASNFSPDLPYQSWMNVSIHLMLTKYVVICYFFTGNEDVALELCERYWSRHFVFQFLRSTLSLKYNSSITTSDNDRVFIIEHSYNKSSWLLINRSVDSCVKLLENVIFMLYKQNHTFRDSFYLYESFLGLPLDFIDGRNVDLTLNVTDNERKILQQSSSIWLCYVSLLVYTNNVPKISHLFKSNLVLSLPIDHLTRIAQFVLSQIGKMYVREQYYNQIRSILLSIEKSLDYVHFLELFRCLNFEILFLAQLRTWLFLIDFCVIRFTEANVDDFLVKVSRKLCQSDKCADSCYTFHHIVMCYPIRSVEIWLNFIQLQLVIASPLHELIDICELAINQFQCSRSLWQHYYSCAVKAGVDEMIQKVESNAKKFGFDMK